MRRRVAAVFIGTALATQAPSLVAQQVAPVAAGARADTIVNGRRVRPMPLVVGGTVGGALLGGVAGAGLGYLALSGDDGGDEFISNQAAATVLVGALGYVVGAGVGAHFAASTAPRPNALATIGVSLLTAAGAGLIAGGLASSVGSDAGSGTASFIALAGPVVHLGLTAAFARWRALKH